MNANPHFPAKPSSNSENRVARTLELLEITRPLDQERVILFGVVLDEELKRLEDRFANFVTHRSARGSLGREELTRISVSLHFVL